MLGYLSLDIISSSKLTVFLELRSDSENCSLLGTDNVREQISELIFAPNGDYCLYNYSPNTCCEKYLKDNKDNTTTVHLHFGE